MMMPLLIGLLFYLAVGIVGIAFGFGWGYWWGCFYMDRQYCPEIPLLPDEQKAEDWLHAVRVRVKQRKNMKKGKEVMDHGESD